MSVGIEQGVVVHWIATVVVLAAWSSLVVAMIYAAESVVCVVVEFARSLEIASVGAQD